MRARLTTRLQGLACAAIASVALVSAAHAASSITRTTAFDYDTASGLLTKEMVEPGSAALCVVTAYALDAYGRRETTTTRNCAGAAGTTPGATTEAAAPGAGTAPVFASRSSTTTFSTSQLVATTTNALGHREIQTHDGRFGNPTELTGPNDLVTRWAYDSFGRKIRERRADDNGTQWEYQLCTTMTGGTLSCPTIGNATTANAVTTTPIRFASDTSWSANGRYVRVYYDTLGREIRTETQGSDVSGSSRLIYQDTQYDARGQVLRKSRPYYSGDTAYWVSYTYDVLGRVITQDSPTETAASGSIVRTEYSGLTLRVTDPMNHTTTEEKNVAGQIFRTTDARGGTLERRYDAYANLVQSKDAKGNITSLAYDQRGRKTAMYDPDMGTWGYCYDALGQLKAQQSPNMRGSDTPAACPASTGVGTTATAVTGWTTIAYDTLGRMTHRVEPDAASTWTYDRYADASTCAKGTGKLCQTTGANGHDRKYEFDSLGRLVRTTSTVGTAFVAQISYDAQSRLDVLTYPSGLSVKHVYTAGFGVLKQVLDNRNAAALWTATAADAEDRVVQYSYGNGVVTNEHYYPGTGQLDTTQAGPSNAVQNLAHSRDPAGRVIGRYDMLTGVSSTYVYDEINRVNTETRTGGSLTAAQVTAWTYDAIGNIATRTEAGSTNTYNYNPSGSGSNKPHAVANISGFVNGYGVPFYAYDNNGNLTGGAGRSVSWTSFDKVSSISKGSARLDYLYDADHERAKESYYANGALQRTTIYLNPAAGAGLYYEDESGTAGIKKKHYLSAGGVTIGMIVCTAVPCTNTANTATQYWHKDHLGSTSVVTNAAGAVIERLAYEPFGKRLNSNGVTDTYGTLAASSTDRGFTGHEHLDEVGLVNMNGRVFDPALGRFMSADPFIQAANNLQSYNRYSYVWNNPLGGTDPSGYSWISDRWKNDIWNRPLGRAAVTIAAGTLAWQFAGDWLLANNIGWATTSSGGTIVYSTQVLSTAGNVAAGAVGGFAGGLVGSSGDLTAGLQGALTGGAFGFVGSQWAAGTFGNYAGHAVVGCASGAMGGSGCGRGAVSQLFSKYVTVESGGDFAATVAAGGTASVIGGGKFANGAITAAYGYLFNACAHMPACWEDAQRAFVGAYRYVATTVLDGIGSAWESLTTPRDVIIDGVNYGPPVGGSLPVGGVGKGAVAGAEKLLFRRGPHDTKALLEAQAQAAEQAAGIGIHGVSVSTSSAARAGQVVRCATCSSVEAAGFKVQQTGGNLNHHTVELPKPITPEVVRIWNELFK